MTKARATDRNDEAPRPVGWTGTYNELSAADRRSPLEPPDLERLAMAAYMIGKETETIDVLTRAHNAFLSRGEITRATRSAFWLTFALLNNGERARAAGWVARVRRLLEDGQQESVEHGYLLLPTAFQHVAEGNMAAANAAFTEAARIGERFGDADLVNLARQGCARTLIALGQTAQGIHLMDEVMVAVTSGELTPPVAGTIYCSVISACFDMFDMRRAQEWTDALAHWCRSQPDLVPYRGTCLVHRAEIMQLHGLWPDALHEAQQACERLSQPSTRPGAGAAFYQLAELHRLRGEFDKAEHVYRMASESGRAPHPGLALLRSAQGRHDAAKAAISRVVDETHDWRLRPRVLAAYIDILLAADDVVAARGAADELAAVVGNSDSAYLRALSAHATGAVLLAEGDARNALASLRDACRIWQELDAPYEAARTTVLLGLSCRQLGDVDGGHMELNAASRSFLKLGAAPDVARVASLCGTPTPDAPCALTAREVQVLKLVASGKTNRSIADELKISEKTVARHISNIFTKLDLSSRAAATAYAFTHQLV